ncbi:threonine aldolase family protein [Roseibium album]|uniref:L-threonine aldolase n=1 Tax=Roseibium album TaxID=311410 RepID=A0A0M6Z5K9_9HYPH|nr:low specificity L-threonine aldolase [Roseibium album]CTQ57352.1 Low specificity L-threonine aldolase [Roseibium album]CTQ69755.1 Low specificity L-threonine aldolase [Roseibium album]CTQ71751.1 Low specificity L-threonine aldolase [Roseibium album]
MNFASDNWAGAAPAVMSALTRHNSGYAPAYGTDQLTDSINQKFNDIFEREVAVFFVATGTAANALSLAAYSKPGGAIFCHRDSHINIDECNCPEFMTSGNKLVGIPGDEGKIAPETLNEAMSAFPDGVVHHGQVASVSISQASECGTVYSLDEIAAIKEIANSRSVPLHMDGARLANALVTLDCTPAEMTWKSGVDVLSFGATKNGCWCAEAAVFFDADAAMNFEYFRKRGGHLFSKSRFVAAQFDGYFENDNWLATARHANDAATRLAHGIRAAGGRTAWAVEANELFPILRRHQFDTLQSAGAKIYEWPAKDLSPEHAPAKDEVCFRMVTSFATQREDVEAFLNTLAGTL